MPEKTKPDQHRTERKRRQDARDDRKQREYRGPDGEIHHHTKKYMEQHERSRKAD